MIISPDKSGNIDPIVYNIIQGVNSPIPIVPITRLNDFVFNDRLLELKEYVLVDFCEYGYDWDMRDTHLFGQNTLLFRHHFDTAEWQKFDQWVTENPPRLYFKRELLKQDVTENVIPIEYPCWYSSQNPLQTKDEFNSRRLEVAHYWGFSHTMRKTFQGNSYLHAVKEDITIIDNIYYYDKFLQENHRRYWFNAHIPHFARVQIDGVFAITNNAKLCVSLPGAGVKCFRSMEAPFTSVVVMREDDIAWTYDWVHNENCIKFVGDDPIPAIEEALRNPQLYEIFLKGQEVVEKYKIGNYINNYLLKEINARVS